MKGGIAAMAFALHALKEAGFEPAGRIVSVSVPDEETSGPRGTVALAAAGLIEPDAIGMLTMEPTSGVVWNANRGVITLRVTIRGRPAHVGLHFRGVNAFRGMLDVAGALAALEAEVAQRRTAFTIGPEAARSGRVSARSPREARDSSFVRESWRPGTMPQWGFRQWPMGRACCRYRTARTNSYR